MTPEIAYAIGLKEPKGALIADVVAGGPADYADIRRGDIIKSFDGREIKNISDLPKIVAETTVGKTVEMKIIRQGKELTINIKVGEMP